MVWGADLASTHLTEEEYTEVVDPRPPAPPFDAQREVRPHRLPPEMDYPPVQDIGEGNPVPNPWHVESFKGFFCIFYGALGFPMVVCDDEDDANTISNFLNQLDGFDASDIRHTIWL